MPEFLVKLPARNLPGFQALYQMGQRLLSWVSVRLTTRERVAVLMSLGQISMRSKIQLRDRGIRVVDALGIMMSVGHQPGMLQADHVHLTAEGHRRVATQLIGAFK
jgi:hypothetical protein